MHTITIREIETKPERDPYHADTGGITRTAIEFDPQERTLTVYQLEDSNSTPMTFWHNHYYRWSVTEHPSENDMQSWIEDNMSYFERIAAGHSIEWDGNNMTGHLTEDAADAYEVLTSYGIEQFADMDYYQLWSIEEWLEPVEDDAIGMTDAEVRKLAEQCMMAKDVWQILEGDADAAYEYLIKYRNEHTDT